MKGLHSPHHMTTVDEMVVVNIRGHDGLYGQVRHTVTQLIAKIDDKATFLQYREWAIKNCTPHPLQMYGGGGLGGSIM